MYSSESSDSESGNNLSCLDLSYLLLDSESIALHLLNSVQEQVAEKNARAANKETMETLDRRETKLPSKASPSMATSASSVRQKANHSSLNSRRTGSGDDSSVETDKLLRDMFTKKLLLHHNFLLTLPFEVTLFTNLKFLDLSNNNLTHVNDFLMSLVNLQTLYLKNNSLGDDALPKDLSALNKLQELNLSGNHLTMIPPQLYSMVSLKYLYLGGNEIEEVLSDIKNLCNLQVLHLGGNRLEKVPDELGLLHHLSVLVLCDNHIRRLPRIISQLTRLRSLLLHKNNLCCLPVGIVKLRSLTELSLRDNPLVNKFVSCCAKEIIYTPPSLLELAARVIKLKDIKYERSDIPAMLDTYVNSGQKCVNPKCKGMYFTSCVEHIKFVDFCGKYRVPLMHYLCSSKCSSTTPTYYKSRLDSDSEEDGPDVTLRKVLLG